MPTSSTNSKDFFVYETDRGNKYLIPLKYKSLTTVSDIIRAMSADGYSEGALSKSTGIRREHVNNVLGKYKVNENVQRMIEEILSSE